MAHPKRRQSKTRTAKRRTHDKIVENGMFITLYVELADTTEVNSQSKKKQLYNCSTV